MNLCHFLKSAACAAGLLELITGAARAGEIVWITQVQSDSGIEFPALLRAAGHTVTERLLTSATLDQTAIDELNAADLVILSKKLVSSNYNTPDWDDAITTPMIVMTPFVTRSSIWGWFGGTGLVDQNPATMGVVDETHPLFNGVTVTDGTTGPWYLTPTVGLGTSFSTDGVINGGILLATTPSGAVAAAQWPARDPDLLEGVAAGPRMLLCMGSRELSGAAIDTAGKYNISTIGERILLNAVNLYAPLPTDDADGDKVPDAIDAFPNDPAEWLDTDGDKIGNNADTDDDNDGVPDAQDLFPLDAAESTDADADGIGDHADSDDDNDWVPDLDDTFPLNPAEWDDTDGDGIGDNADPDADGNGLPDPDISRVIWVSQVDNGIGQEFITLLEHAGHTVERFVGTSQTLADNPALVARVMETADLVVVSRQIGSDVVNTAVWDQIRTPMIVMSPYLLRPSRWGWLNGEGLAGSTPFLMVPEPDQLQHPLFGGVAVDNTGATETWYTEVGQGTSFSTEIDAPGGMVLARTDSGGMAAAQWPAGTVAAGPRLYLSMGAWEPAGTTVAEAGGYNITPVGERILLNAAAIYTTPVPRLTFDITTVSRNAATGAVSVTWESEAGQNFVMQRSRNLKDWEPVVSNIAGTAGTSSATDSSPPAGTAPVFYRVVRTAAAGGGG